MPKTQYDEVNVANSSNKRKMNIDNLGNVIRYSSMPSLQHISAVNIIIALWRQADFQHQLVGLFYKYSYDQDLLDMCEIEMRQVNGVKIMDRLSQLPVPNLIRTIFSNIVDPIGEEIYNWMHRNKGWIFSNYFFDDSFSGDSVDEYYWRISAKPLALNFMDYLVWTSRGRIDFKRTGKNLLDHIQLSNNDQLDLACSYCLEDDIAIIAPKVVDTLDIVFESKPMIYFWNSCITGDVSELDKAVTSYNTRKRTDYTTNECILDILIYGTRNETAIKYIWDKLNNEEKSRHCISVITQVYSIDLQCFILSQLNEEQQEGVFKACACNILLSLLEDWLWRTDFSPTLYHIWNVMTERQYLSLLESIVFILEESNRLEATDRYIEKYDRYRAAFKESWRGAPAHLKQYVLEHENGCRCHQMFFGLFCEKNVDILQSILFDCNYAQKQNIIFSENCSYRCHQRMNEQYGLLETLIEYTLVSEGDGECSKQKSVKESREFISYFLANKKWNELEQSEKWAFKRGEDLEQFYEALHDDICRNRIKAFVLRYKGNFAQLEHLSNW